ncbi:MAG TPA: hypothetical protein VGC09_23200 [Rhodopila sp.]
MPRGQMRRTLARRNGLRPRWPVASLALLLAVGGARAGPLASDLHLDLPPVITDDRAPPGCTVTYLVTNTEDNDLFAARMRVASADTDAPSNGRMPCPVDIPTRVGLRALDECATHAGASKYCVFTDMSRGFEHVPDVRNTSEIDSRCASDKFSDIGAACWMSGDRMVCNVGCGNSPAQAVAQARARCEAKQQRSCPVTATVPVSGP